MTSDYDKLMQEAKHVSDTWKVRIADGDTTRHVVIGDVSDDDIDEEADTEIHYDECEYFQPED